jgi:hypothetical protein
MSWQVFSKRRDSRVGLSGSEGAKPTGSRFSAGQGVRLVRASRGLHAGAEGRIIGLYDEPRRLVVRFQAKVLQVRPDELEPLPTEIQRAA